jgi:hypothetical protein
MVGDLAFRASFPRTASTPRDAWHDLAGWLPQRCGSSAAETALVLTSELVTNAVVHTRSAEVAVRARCNGDTLVIAVDDDESALAVPGDCCSGRPTGAGLALMDSLALRWGWEPLHAGKRVWFEVRCSDEGNATDGGPAASDRRVDGVRVP